VLTELVEAGAPSEILWSSKPHIGTFRLVKVVENIRARIESLGGEMRFGARVTGLHLDGGRVRGVTLDGGDEIRTDQVVLAVGHSARDTFEMLHAAGVEIVAKPFSVGFRIEHPQSLIDRARFGEFAGDPRLGAADYKLIHHARNGRSVYSFCMCPGGTVVAAASEPGRVVTNGMSQYSRAERNANAGIVVGITPEDYPDGPLAGIAFQRRLEEQAFALGGSNYHAPVQRLGDFLRKRPSAALGEVLPSYTPGVTPTALDPSLPAWAIDAIREAIPAFDRTLRGFALPARRRLAAECEHAGSLPRWRRRRLRRRHPLLRNRRNPRRRSGRSRSPQVALQAATGTGSPDHATDAGGVPASSPGVAAQRRPGVTQRKTVDSGGVAATGLLRPHSGLR
jgi:uncharacterized FAD-dependent dehydrogenase